MGFYYEMNSLELHVMFVFLDIHILMISYYKETEVLLYNLFNYLLKIHFISIVINALGQYTPGLTTIHIDQ